MTKMITNSGHWQVNLFTFNILSDDIKRRRFIKLFSMINLKSKHGLNHTTPYLKKYDQIM